MFDKRIPEGCSRRRPNMYMDFGSHVVAERVAIIIEIDENQHSDYDCTCENKLLMELFQDCGNR